MEYLDGMTLRQRIGGKPVELDVLLGLESKLPTRWTQRTLKESFIATSSLPIFSSPTRSRKNSGFRPGEEDSAERAKWPRMTTLGADATPAEASAEQFTSPGTAVGTVAYMSPEQVRGKELDSAQRSFFFRDRPVRNELRA